ncbi:MAG: M28 family metallopeptidase [bacterium]
MEKELKEYIDRLSLSYEDRFIGSAGHRKTFSYLVDQLRSWGLWVRTQPFHVDITVPWNWLIEIDFGKGFEEVDALPGIGSPTIKGVEAEIVPVGYARDEDYASGDDYSGKVHLARLWKSHETDKVTEAALKGAPALLWYNEHFDELYSGACDYSLAPIPGISIRKTIAEKLLEAGGGRVRISVRSKMRRIRCRNIIAGHGQEDGRHAILTSHYDTRPRTPGASDDASGVSVMLTFIRNRLWKGLPFDVRFFFADCEEEGCVGAHTLAAYLHRRNLLKDVSCVVNLDAVGWPNLCLITGDREAVLDEDLTDTAADVMRNLGYTPEKVRSRTGKSNHTPFALLGVKSLWISDYPNYVRHSVLDNAFNIDYPTMNLVTKALPRIFSELS